jgi:hypothetical protein
MVQERRPDRYRPGLTKELLSIDSRSATWKPPASSAVFYLFYPYKYITLYFHKWQHRLHKPGFERPRGGEFAAEDCLLDGYHGVIDMWASIRVFDGDVEPDINLGVPVVDIRLGEAEVDIILGVASGVRRGVMCVVREYFWIGGLAAVPDRFSTAQTVETYATHPDE